VPPLRSPVPPSLERRPPKPKLPLVPYSKAEQAEADKARLAMERVAQWGAQGSAILARHAAQSAGAGAGPSRGGAV